MSGVAILGAGHAGGTLAALLRQYAYEGPITLVGDEPSAPYQRPPLSKAWLKGEADADSLSLKPLGFYAENDIDFRPSVHATQIDRAAKRVSLGDGDKLPYDKLVIATGARAIALPIPGADLAGVMFLRTAKDAEQLKSVVGPGKQIVVVGGGYVGLEVAASGRALGASVVVLERETRILARVACEVLSDFFQDRHKRHGVVFELSCGVVGFEGQDGVVHGVRLGDGRLVTCDAVVVGVGATPNDELATGCGLITSRGVVVDLQARSSDPDIFAIGDVAFRPMPIYDRMFRMESVPNALEQAKQAGCAITGRPAPRGECPWQWSDQYDLKLQIAGYAFDASETVVRGDPATNSFAVFHLLGDRLQSVEAINAPPEFMMGKQLILSRTPVDRTKLADPSLSIRDVAA